LAISDDRNGNPDLVILLPTKRSRIRIPIRSNPYIRSGGRRGGPVKGGVQQLTVFRCRATANALSSKRIQELLFFWVDEHPSLSRSCTVTVRSQTASFYSTEVSLIRGPGFRQCRWIESRWKSSHISEVFSSRLVLAPLDDRSKRLYSSTERHFSSLLSQP